MLGGRQECAGNYSRGHFTMNLNDGGCSLLLAQLTGWCCWSANLCAGHGFADIVVRKYGTKKPPYNCSKSYIGSLAFASASLVYMEHGSRTPTNFLALMPL